MIVGPTNTLSELPQRILSIFTMVWIKSILKKYVVSVRIWIQSRQCKFLLTAQARALFRLSHRERRGLQKKEPTENATFASPLFLSFSFKRLRHPPLSLFSTQKKKTCVADSFIPSFVALRVWLCFDSQIHVEFSCVDIIRNIPSS